MGEALRPLCTTLTGWDISTEMLRAAEAKGIYEHLGKRDLNRLSPPRERWQVITAADVFIYLGALEKIIGWVALALESGGQFVFTVEEHTGPEAYVLRDTCRYAHSAHALQDLLDQAGFDSRITRAVLREDRGAPVWALVVHAVKRGPAPSAEQIDGGHAGIPA
jgi:predicted TPR repeat methyltransferase